VSARTLVIVNPRSRNGVTGRRWKALQAGLRGALGPFDVEHTRAPRDAERIAREGVRAGIERVIIAGGDGTVNEVVTGLLAAGLGGYAEIGLLPLGTGGDFTRSLGIPPGLDEAVALLAAGKARQIDAGRITYRDAASRNASAYFVNVASLGISGLIDQLVNRATKRFGGGASFLIGTIKAIARHRSEHVTLRVDGEVVHDGPLVLAAAANGRYFGGGMYIAPEARLDDGLFDVVLVSDLSKRKLLAKLPLLYLGKHLNDPECRFLRGRAIEAEAAPGAVLLDIDGEALGSLPARMDVMPNALRVIGAAE
jgi:YegS/Rv2252/BmrU family lipid kinase